MFSDFLPKAQKAPAPRPKAARDQARAPARSQTPASVTVYTVPPALDRKIEAVIDRFRASKMRVNAHLSDLSQAQHDREFNRLLDRNDYEGVKALSQRRAAEGYAASKEFSDASMALSLVGSELDDSFFEALERLPKGLQKAEEKAQERNLVTDFNRAYFAADQRMREVKREVLELE